MGMVMGVSQNRIYSYYHINPRKKWMSFSMKQMNRSINDVTFTLHWFNRWFEECLNNFRQDENNYIVLILVIRMYHLNIHPDNPDSMKLLTATNLTAAEIAQLGERQTEDLKVPGSIPGFGTETSGDCLGIFFNMFSFSCAVYTISYMIVA